MISIIALLIAILLPALSRTKESANRTQCSANVRSVTQAHIILGESNKSRYRLTNRWLGSSSFEYRDTTESSYDEIGNPMSDHISQINKHVYIDMLDNGIDFSNFSCPNRGLDFVVTQPRSLPIDALKNPRDYPDLIFVRTAFYQMAGRDQRVLDNQTNFPPPRPGQVNRRWLSPKSLDDSGELPMAACMIEKGTINPALSTFPHGPKGMIEARQSEFPDSTKSEGGNVAANDGSVLFLRTEDAARFPAHPGASNIVGHWQDVDAYNRVNQ